MRNKVSNNTNVKLLRVQGTLLLLFGNSDTLPETRFIVFSIFPVSLLRIILFNTGKFVATCGHVRKHKRLQTRLCVHPCIVNIFMHSHLLHSARRLSIKPRRTSGTMQRLSISGNNNGLAVGKYSTVGAFYMSYRRANCCTGNGHLIFPVTLILSMIYANNFCVPRLAVGSLFCRYATMMTRKLYAQW